MQKSQPECSDQHGRKTDGRKAEFGCADTKRTESNPGTYRTQRGARTSIQHLIYIIKIKRSARARSLRGTEQSQRRGRVRVRVRDRGTPGTHTNPAAVEAAVCPARSGSVGEGDDAQSRRRFTPFCFKTRLNTEPNSLFINRKPLRYNNAPKLWLTGRINGGGCCHDASVGKNKNDTSDERIANEPFLFERLTLESRFR